MISELSQLSLAVVKHLKYKNKQDVKTAQNVKHLINTAYN